ncbi:DNA end-binding protein Ku [Jatrophihabitans sp. GAS493]|uniref:non-homologous end joining protein Ku n=1 Tax=Jatrophihabitans sp. GAS493 TaxID=1907575 RepID=UPI000BB6DFFF|nr:Ku protein [Jatrophihabitans sp. GAS493]SOD73173.1 DNA end-binding protein Ku [Jatrophihabitans sp. GAS493]
MRSIWKGAVSFGLVSIGVKMYSATEERDVSFHQVRRSDGSRIRYRRVAEADGEEVAYGDIAKGYALPSGEIVVLTDEDFADLPLPTVRAVDVLQFVPDEQIDPIYFAKSYYLEPEQSAVKPYVLLRDALADSGMVAVVKVAIRNREQLATLRVREGVIVLETMVWPDEVREADFAFLETDVTLRPQERDMAQSLVQSMSGDFDPEQYTDEYRAALQQVIDAKVEGREVVEVADAQPSTGTVIDLMAALRASVDAAKRGRGEATGKEATGTEASAKAPPAAKTPASQTPAKKAAAKTTAAKAAAKKAPPTKSTASKSTAAKSTASKSTAEKPAAKRAPAKKTPAKAAAKKATASNQESAKHESTRARRTA